MVNVIRAARRVRVTGDGKGVASHAGGLLVAEMADRVGLTAGFSEAMAHTRQRRSAHDPGVVLAHLAVSLADGGDCLADIAVLRDQPELFGQVASDPTVWRVIDSIHSEGLAGIAAARAAARARVWAAGGAPGEVVIDIDGTLLDAYSEKQDAASTYKHGFGFYPIVGTVALADVAPIGEGGGMTLHRSRPVAAVPSSAFVGFRFPPEIIVLAVRWYLRYGLSYRDVEELLGERGIEVDHVTIYRWVQQFTPLLVDAAGPCRHAVGDRWYVDETYVKVAGKWRYVYRAVDQYGQIIDVLVSARRDIRAARRFFMAALRAHREPVEVMTDRAPALRAAIEGLMPAAFHNTEQYANNRVECDHGRLKARLRPMRGLKRDHTARVIMRGHALMQNIRRGHYELGSDARYHKRIETAFTELARTI